MAIKCETLSMSRNHFRKQPVYMLVSHYFAGIVCISTCMCPSVVVRNFTKHVEVFVAKHHRTQQPDMS